MYVNYECFCSIYFRKSLRAFISTGQQVTEKGKQLLHETSKIIEEYVMIFLPSFMLILYLVEFEFHILCFNEVLMTMLSLFIPAILQGHIMGTTAGTNNPPPPPSLHGLNQVGLSDPLSTPPLHHLNQVDYTTLCPPPPLCHLS